MRQALAGALLATSVATAAPAFAPPPKPGPPVRKPATLEFTAEALAEFAEASMADKAGDLEAAENHYRRAVDQGDQPNAYFNLADVQRRMERYKEAIESYGKYLDAAPDAPDRAEVESVIARLKATPPIVTIDGDDTRAVVFVDGVLVGPSPQTVQLTEGKHVVMRIGPASIDHQTFTLKALEMRHVQSYARSEVAGNVVLSAAAGVERSGGWRDDQREWRIPERFTLAPGHYETRMFGPKYLCSPVAFDVPKGDGVLFVYIDAPVRDDSASGCIPITVRTKKLSFPP